jgi:hypothetical protein
MRALATPRSSCRTRLGRRVLLAESANVSAVPRTKSATSTRPTPIVPVSGDAADDAEQEHRQPLTQERHRDQERIARQRRDQQWPRGQGNAVADVVDHRRRKEPPEVRAEAARDDGEPDTVSGPKHAGSVRCDSSGMPRRTPGPVRESAKRCHSLRSPGLAERREPPPGVSPDYGIVPGSWMRPRSRSTGWPRRVPTQRLPDRT